MKGFSPVRLHSAEAEKQNVPAGVKELPLRDEIGEQYRWNLEDIYEDQAKWEEDFKWVEDQLPGYEGFKGHLGKSAKVLCSGLRMDDEVGMKISRLYLYAMLSKDLDLADSDSRARYDRIAALYARAGAASSFMRPEIVAIPEDRLKSFLSEFDELKVYEHMLGDLLRTKAHTLSKEQEEILALSAEISHIPYNTFSIFTDAEMQFPVVKDSEGREVKISHGRYTASLYSLDRRYRQDSYKAFYKPFIEYKNTLSVLFNGIMKVHAVNSNIRHYESSRAAALDANNIPGSVYDNLIESVNQNLGALHRWAGIKKRVLGLEELHPYDLYVTLFPAVKDEYSYEKGKQAVLESVRPLGEDYVSSIRKAFDNRWIDVYETRGKRSGAYSSGTTFGVHPYVLLNWNGQLNDVFTLAHEMGHNMHSYYTLQSQPYPYADYSIFLAEVASTANEALLLDYLIERAESKEEKLSLIEKYLTNITTTFYRQTLFAEFELKTHQMMEASQPLTPDMLCQIYGELTKRYWGETLTMDDEEAYTWARVPHFYYNYYVYQYATGYAASQALVHGIKTEGAPAIERYLDFLKAGSSDYPINVLKKAGVDMSSSEPVRLTIEKMNELLDQMEGLL